MILHKNSSKLIIREICFIFFLCFVCNWMLLLNDGFFWDDNVYYGLIQNRHYKEFSNFIFETGLPINILFFRGLDLTVGITNHRYVSFITIFLSAVLLNEIFKLIVSNFTKYSLVFVTLYLSVFPFKSTVLLCTTVYQVMLMFFLLAIYIRIGYRSSLNQKYSLLALFSFLILSFLSFNTASILVLYYFFLTYEYFFIKNFSQLTLNWNYFGIFLKKNILELFLPIVYWLIKCLYFPSYGLYLNYNKITFDLSRNWDAVKAFFSTLFMQTAIHKFSIDNAVLIFIVLFLSLTLAALPRFLMLDKYFYPIRRVSRWVTLFWITSFLIVSALPYVLVFQGPRLQGWESRHLILFTISFPIFILVTIYIYLDLIKSQLGIRSVKLIFKFIIIFISILGILSSNIIYKDYQLLAIKQWSIVENLKLKPELRQCSRFVIKDLVGDFSRKEFTWPEANHQDWFEWVAIFTKAWGSERWYAYNDDRNEEYFKGIRYSASDINPYGRKCSLIIKNISSKGGAMIMLNYWKVKYFGTQVQLQDYLISILTIESYYKNK